MAIVNRKLKMVKIRSITYFCNPGWPLKGDELQRAGEFIALALTAFTAQGYEVQTTRLATIPFPDLVKSLDKEEITRLAQALERLGQELGFAYVALGPALPERPESYLLIPQALAGTENVFLAGLMTTPDGGISLPAVRACAEVIHQAAPISPDGFANLRFAALANVPPGTPFFPAAFHDQDNPKFALATEAAGLAVEATTQARSLEDARSYLVSGVEDHASRLSAIAGELASRLDVEFGGIDFSLAPFPQKELSFGTAIERLGVPTMGQHGSLAAAAILAEALDRAQFLHTGFSGLMMPVLEDAILAQRAGEGTLTVKDLLLYSAVCGSGLDTVPLPGDATVDQLYALLLDVAALAIRLNKPLTARLMPIPGKVAGDPTGFDFAFFANSRVMALEAGPLGKPLGGNETFKLLGRR